MKSFASGLLSTNLAVAVHWGPFVSGVSSKYEPYYFGSILKYHNRTYGR